MNRLRRVLRHKLQRKLIRDLMASKGLFLSVAAVIFLGVSFFGGSFMGYQNLRTSYDYTYETLHFADFTVEVVEAPVVVVADLESIPGVEAVTGRANRDVSLTLPGEAEKRVLARVISLPSGSRPAVNDVKVEEGAYFAGGESNTLLVERNFAEHHGLKPGDTLLLTGDAGGVSFEIAGIVASPEYIWPAKNRQEILVSPETFGVVFVPEEAVAGLTGASSLNEFCFLVEDGADRESIMGEVEKVLDTYVVMDVVPQEQQHSNAAVLMQLEQMGGFAGVFPLLFLIVGALATYILLTRIIYNQRSQIGLMRAVGYTRRQVLLHYLGFALIIGIVGAVAGTIAGFFLSELITSLYTGILGIPYTRIEMNFMQWIAIEEGLMLGIIPCAIAGIIPAWAASRISPAEAMRPPAPTAGRKLLLERIFPFLTGLSFLWKIPLRNIFRNRRRSLYTVIGVAFGISLILVSAAFIDAFDAFMDLQFNKVQIYDARIVFSPNQPQSATVAGDVQGWEEVTKAEPVLELPVRMEHGDRNYSTLVVGLSPDAGLYGLYSPGGDRLSLSADGILLSEALKKTLDVDTGETITLVSPWGKEQFEVTGFISQPIGSYGYVTLTQAQGMTGGMPLISSIMMKVEPQYVDSIREKAYGMPGTSYVELTGESNEKVDQMMGLIKGMSWVMLAFGAALALAIVFTTVTVSILERRREIATMRTLGEGRRRIMGMITIENLLLGLTGVIPGIPLGYLLALYLFSLFQSDMMTYQMVIFPRTYLMTVGLVILIMLISQ
ncbi:MAG: ABC transporter permease, partial [Dehalococcoidia bacterium]|nr:ABC transporter permease [Dehalococcoidia bacterium]